jgi:histidine triad (HIT) family protein
MPEPEQESQEELMERVKKMSPEELLEFQKSRCIFCQIITGKIQSKKIYEDSKVCGILDINPANPGHILLMPKEHYSIMPQVPRDVLEHLFIVSKRLGQISLQALGAKGTNIIVQNGIAAGQKAQHFMIHIIPRKENDGLPLALEKKTISDNDYNTIMERLKKKIGEYLEIKEEPKETEIKTQSPLVNNDNKIKERDKINNNILEQKKETPEVEQNTELINQAEQIETEDISNSDIQEDNIDYNQKHKFITSSTAKRYHVSNCAFAQNIQLERRIFLTKDDAENSGRKPCTCVSGDKIPLEKQDNIKDELEIANSELDNINEDVENIKTELKRSNQEDSSIDLDEISRILGR